MKRLSSTYRVPRLLSKDLCELDHVGIVLESLREVDHAISGVLLVARTRSGQEGAERVHDDGVALLPTASGITCSFPFLRRVRNGLRDTFVERVRADRRECGKEEKGWNKDHGERRRNVQ